MRLRRLTQLPTHIPIMTKFSYMPFDCKINWHEGKNHFEGPHYDPQYASAYHWCARCERIGCSWSNPNCPARLPDGPSPDWEERAANKRASHEAYLQRKARRDIRKAKKDLGSAAAKAFGYG